MRGSKGKEVEVVDIRGGKGNSAFSVHLPFRLSAAEASSSDSEVHSPENTVSSLKFQQAVAFLKK
jgi:hypothetical protein